jgi:hypothetical protein
MEERLSPIAVRIAVALKKDAGQDDARWFAWERRKSNLGKAHRQKLFVIRPFATGEDCLEPGLRKVFERGPTVPNTTWA